MAKEMNAIIKYRPRIILEKTVDKAALAEHISQRSAMTKGDVSCVIDELVDNMINNLKFARPVKIDGIGTFYPAVKLSGKMTVNFRPDTKILHEIVFEKFGGDFINKANAGKSVQDLVELWNEENPDDLIPLPTP